MRYKITATSQSESRAVDADTAEQALNAIDDFASAGFRLDRVTNQDGIQIDPIELLKEWVAKEIIVRQPH